MLWMCFVTNMLVTTIYYILSGATFVKLIAVRQRDRRRWRTWGGHFGCALLCLGARPFA